MRQVVNIVRFCLLNVKYILLLNRSDPHNKLNMTEGLLSVWKGDVGIDSTIFFEASPGEVASSRLELRNEGNTSIFYSWQQLDVSSSLWHLLSHRRRSCFYFNQSSGTCGPRPGVPSPPVPPVMPCPPVTGVILPGVTQQIDLMFKSGVPGLHTESWQLQTNPVLLQGASVQVTLMGFAVSEDRTAELRRHLEVSYDQSL